MRQLTTLDNKIRIVSQEFKDRNSAAIGVWIGAGGRYENAQNKGVAHFLEHMAFKGSLKYSCDEVKQLVEGVGGNLNAFTSEEETCYYGKVPAKHLSTTFDVLTDISIFPKIAPKDVEKERTVILEEIKMYLDLPQYHVGEILQELLWPEHPLGESLAGTPASVTAMKSQGLRDFHRKQYVPGNIVVAACGNIKHDDLVKWTAKKLGRNKTSMVSGFLSARRDQLQPALMINKKKTEQMHLALGYLAYENNHPDYYVLGLLSIMLGGNMSSRLFNEVREKRGLAYSVSSGMKSLDDTGCFIVRAGVDNAKIVPALELILKVLDSVMLRDVSVDEFKRAKEYYIGQFLLGLEDTMDHMIWLGSVILSKDSAKTVADVIKRINAVTIKDVRRVAKQVLAARRLNMALIGPITDQQEAQIRRIIA